MVGNWLVMEQTFTVENYLNLTAPAVPNGEAGTVGTWDYEDLATALSKAFTSADNKVVINAVYSNRIFAIAGDGTVIGWEFENMVEGRDYEILSETDNSITIRVFDTYSGNVIANAIVEYVASAETETAEKKTNNEPSSLWFWGLLIVLVAGLGFVLVRKDNK